MAESFGSKTQLRKPLYQLSFKLKLNLSTSGIKGHLKNPVVRPSWPPPRICPSLRLDRCRENPFGPRHLSSTTRFHSFLFHAISLPCSTFMPRTSNALETPSIHLNLGLPLLLPPVTCALSLLKCDISLCENKILSRN